jgi:transposase InsO family protein
MCREAGVSRASYYRHLAEKQPAEEEQQVRAAMQEIALAHKRRYGIRRITAALQQRGIPVGRDRVHRMLKEDNLLAIRQRRYVITTDSKHDLEVYLNLAGRMRPDAPNQLWVADITYIRLPHEFVYLAVVLDAWSRRVIGWHLDRTLAARLAVTALERAIAARQPKPGLVHHSDRGIQYASHEYVALLQQHGLTPSMSRPANLWDNASCESFMKTLKAEEIYCNEYRDLQDLETHVQAFLEDYYNRLRLHSALGYWTPEQFEQQPRMAAAAELAQAPKMSFFRHAKSTDPMQGTEASGGQ